MSRNKTILQLSATNDWKQKKIELSEPVKLFYSAWSNIAKDMGVELVRSSVYYFRKGTFTQHWKIENGEWVKVAKPVTPTVIFDRSWLYEDTTALEIDGIYKRKLEIARSFPMVNEPEFVRLLNSKLNQAVLFRKYMPRTEFVAPGDILVSDKDPIVVKSFHGYGGYGVKIVSGKKYIVENRGITQEFVKASKNGNVYDYRIVFLGQKPAYIFTRTGRKDSFFTNFHQGGRVTFLNLKEMKWLVDYAKQIAEPLRIFRKAIFSLDFMVDSRNKKPYLIELNESPGNDVFTEESRKPMEKYIADLTKYILS